MAVWCSLLKQVSSFEEVLLQGRWLDIQLSFEKWVNLAGIPNKPDSIIGAWPFQFHFGAKQS